MIVTCIAAVVIIFFLLLGWTTIQHRSASGACPTPDESCGTCSLRHGCIVQSDDLDDTPKN
jgi:hypothetical protein